MTVILTGGTQGGRGGEGGSAPKNHIEFGEGEIIIQRGGCN